MDKQKAAKQLIDQVLAFLLDNVYIEDDIFAKDDIERLQDIAYYQLSVSCARAIQEARKQDAQ